MSRWIWLSLAATGAAFGATLVVYFGMYNELPHEVPTHWDFQGRPDGWTPKEDVIYYLLIVPASMVGMILLTLILPWISPKPFDVERFRGAYHHVMGLVVLFFAYLHIVFLWGTVEQRLPIDRLLIGGVFLFFVGIGNIMGQLRRNFWIGVRTPWTLASEAVWIGTHRMTAWLWVAFGLVGLVVVLAGVPAVLALTVLVIPVLAPIVYSWWLYRELERTGRLEQT